jgi:DNA-3-methyladenine glycosylase II
LRAENVTRKTGEPGEQRAAGAEALVAPPRGQTARGTVRGRVRTDSSISNKAVAAITDRLPFRLGLDDEVAAFYELAADDPPFRRAITRLHGYHQVKFPSPLELMCWAVLGQRTPLAVARAVESRLGRKSTASGHARGAASWRPLCLRANGEHERGFAALPEA